MLIFVTHVVVYTLTLITNAVLVIAIHYVCFFTHVTEALITPATTTASTTDSPEARTDAEYRQIRTGVSAAPTKYLKSGALAGVQRVVRLDAPLPRPMPHGNDDAPLAPRGRRRGGPGSAPAVSCGVAALRLSRRPRVGSGPAPPPRLLPLERFLEALTPLGFLTATCQRRRRPARCARTSHRGRVGGSPPAGGGRVRSFGVPPKCCKEPERE